MHDHPSYHLLPHPRSSQPPSLSTSVSVIGSTWTPIPTPSISKPLPFSPSSSSSSSTRLTIPSPLVSSTCRTSLGAVATRGPSVEAQMSYFNPFSAHHRPHTQVRRVKSERHHLTYQDSLAKQALRNKNGLLVHRESAPEFVYTSEGLVAYHSNPSIHRDSGLLGTHARASSAQHHHHQPSPLVKDSAHMEVKIECVDMHYPIPTTSHALLLSKGVGHSAEDMHASVSGSIIGKGFNEEKQKFIMEAQNWSKQVDSEIAKKVKEAPSLSSSSLLPPPSSSSVGGTFSLGLLSSVGSQPSLSSKFSPEEQEKFLRQHFEQIMQQQQLLSVGGCPPVALPIPTPAKSPLGGASLSNSTAAVGNSTTALGYTHSPRPSVVAAGTVAHLGQPSKQTHSSSGGGPSPKKTSPLNFFQSSPHGASAPVSMFPFLGQTGSSNTAAAASFLCNPSLSQFPLAAAMFNPVYQAALQQLVTAQQVAGGNAPMIPEPALLQGLMDQVPVVLPDGRVTFVPMGSPAQQGNGEASPSKDKKNEEEEEQDEGEELLKSPRNMSSGCKRMRSPGVDVWSEFRATPPKRRRSSSLPDITHMLQISPHKKLVEGGERDGGKTDERGVMGEVRSNGMTTMMPSSNKSPRSRQHAPPTMIHIPQDVKVNDPMLGFPTPPQSSPLVGSFALSPIVLPSTQYHSSHHHQQHPHQPMTPVTPGHDPLHTAEDLREIMEAGGLQATLPPSPEGSNLPPCKSNSETHYYL